MKQAAVFLCLFVGVLLEQHLWDETMNQSTNSQTVAEYGICEGCEKPEYLLPVEGHGNLCCSCECEMICSDIEAQIKAARASA